MLNIEKRFGEETLIKVAGRIDTMSSADFEKAVDEVLDEAKTLVKAEKGDSSTSATMLKQAVARYDHIITRYGSKLGVNANFIGRKIKSTSGTHNILASADNGLTIAIIVIVSLVSVSSIIGATIVIRKRKTN